MTAAYYESTGPASTVLKVGSLPVRRPATNEVLVRLYAAGVNPAGTKRRGGWGDAPMEAARIVPGDDGAAVVEALGDGVDPSWQGRPVWVHDGRVHQPFGTSSTHITLPLSRIAELPDAVSFEQGASLGVPALTAHYAVMSNGSVRDRVVLVSRAQGSTPYYAAQIAKWGGARVVATYKSSADAEALRSFELDLIFERTDDAADAYVVNRFSEGHGVDRIFEYAFARNIAFDASVLAKHGSIGTFSSDSDPTPSIPFWPLLMTNARIDFLLVYELPKEAKIAAVADITLMLDQGALQHRISHRIALKEVTLAHELVERGNLNGRIVLEIP